MLDFSLGLGETEPRGGRFVRAINLQTRFANNFNCRPATQSGVRSGRTAGSGATPLRVKGVVTQASRTEGEGAVEKHVCAEI